MRRWLAWSSLLGISACAAVTDAPARDVPPPPLLPAAVAASPPPAPAPTVEPVAAPAAVSVPVGARCLLAAYPQALCAFDQGAVVSCSGRRFEYDDGRSKTQTERLEAPDLEDQMAQAYFTGTPSAPPVDVEPGRVRHLPLFESLYGADEAAVRAQLVDVPWLLAAGGRVLRVTAAHGVDARLRAVEKRIAALPRDVQRIAAESAGAYQHRDIAGTDRLSAHAFGIAVDVAQGRADYWLWRKGEPYRNRVPMEIVEAFEAEGFIWGGRWHHYDTMHFEYRPELLAEGCVRASTETSTPPSAATRFGWTTESDADTIAARFVPPAGFQRVAMDDGDFGAFLRALPLLPGTPRVRLYDGTDKGNQSAHAAVVDIDVGSRDLQQCADAVMRLRAEYLWSSRRADEVCFESASGSAMPWYRYRRGERPPAGRATPWTPSAAPDGSRGAFRSYLDRVFALANTASLRRELRRVVDPASIEIGDVYIEAATAGRYGHAVMVVDVVKNDAGERRFLAVQSYMPAQNIQVLRNPASRDGSAWYAPPADGSLVTPEWSFPAGSLHRFGASCR